MNTGRGRGVRLGFGIYATNKRLFGIAQYRPSFDKTLPLIPQNFSQAMNDQVISELKRTKSIEIQADEIAKIELKIPAGIFRGGQLPIHRTTGELVMINIGRKQPGEQLKSLLQVFDAKILTII